jgi:hypothetical protein
MMTCNTLRARRARTRSDVILRPMLELDAPVPFPTRNHTRFASFFALPKQD